MISLLGSSLLITGCFSGKDADPLNGQSAKYIPKEEKDQREAQKDQQIVNDQATYQKRLEELAAKHQSELQRLKQQYDQSLKAHETQKGQGDTNWHQEKQKLVEQVESYKANYEKLVSSLNADINTYKENVSRCEQSQKVVNPQSFKGLLYTFVAKDSLPPSYYLKEGEKKVIQLQTQLAVGGAGAVQNIRVINVNGTPKEIEISKDSSSQDWLMEWTPPIGFTKGQLQSYLYLDLELVLNSENLNDNEKSLLDQEVLTRRILLVVQPQGQPLEIRSIEWQQNVDSAKAISFVVQVADPEGSPVAPNLQFLNSQGTSTHLQSIVDGVSLITQSRNPKKVGEGLWSFEYQMHPELLSTDRSQEVTVKFDVKALSGDSSRVSETVTEEINIQKDVNHDKK